MSDTIIQCDPPVVSNNSTIDIDQENDELVDYCTCQYNSLCTVLSEKLSVLAGVPIRIDVRYLYECFANTYYGKYAPDYKRDGHKEIIQQQDCIRGLSNVQPPRTLEIIQEICARYDRAISLIKWILVGLPPEGSLKKVNRQGKTSRAITLPIRLYCGITTQNYSDEYTVNCDDPDDKCVLNINVVFDYSSKQTPGIKTFYQIIQQLNTNGTVPIAIHVNAKYLDYKNNPLGDPNNQTIWQYGDPIPPEGLISHNITLIGYICEGDDIILLARDYYDYVDGRENIIKFRIPKNRLVAKVPFSQGFLISNIGSITNLEITDITQEDILNALNKCCELTPTPTPSPSPTPTLVSVSPTPMLTPSLPEPTPGI